MDDYRSRPVPTQRSNKTMDARGNTGFGGSFGDKGLMHVSTASMYDNSLEDTFSSQTRGGMYTSLLQFDHYTHSFQCFVAYIISILYIKNIHSWTIMSNFNLT